MHLLRTGGSRLPNSYSTGRKSLNRDRWTSSRATYFVYNINEGLGIFPVELLRYLEAILLREYTRNKRDALLCVESVAD